MTQTLAPSHAPRRQADAPRLTQLSSCAGCAAKLSQAVLADVLSRLPGRSRKPMPNVLVGADTFDDAGVYQIRPDLALVQTVDFFTPIVDDPYDYGQIAATNALSDVYAMGGRPLSALNLLGVPGDKVGAGIIAEILRGGGEKAASCGCAVIGGHTIRLPEPVYGMAVTGAVHPENILRNDRAESGDLLILTKPLGTGIATTGIKRGVASDDLAGRAVRSMKTLNTPGADLAERRLVRCATDVTGFGLLGHLGNIVRASGVGAEVTASAVPPLSPEIFDLIDQDCIPGGTRANLQTADTITNWRGTTERTRFLLTDAQTSGGLLLCVPPGNLSEVKAILRTHRTRTSAIIGKIVQSRSPRIVVQP